MGGQDFIGGALRRTCLTLAGAAVIATTLASSASGGIVTQPERITVKTPVAYNNSGAPITFGVASNGSYFSYTIPAGAMTTFVWR